LRPTKAGVTIVVMRYELRCAECDEDVTDMPRLQLIGSGGDGPAAHLVHPVILCDRDITLPKYANSEVSRRD